MTLAEASDRLALRDLQARYAHGVDRRDLPLVRSCFTPDCRYDGTLGRGTIDVAVYALREAMSRYRATFHLVTTQRIDLHDGAADVDTYGIAHHVLRGPGAGHYTVGVRYLDTCRRTPDGWRIAARTVRRVWERDGLVPLS
jgi:SnoaL-like domain